MKTYEAMIIFPSTYKDNEIEAALERTTADIERTGGKVLHTKMVGKRTFARPMRKHEAGIYIWIAFENDPEAINPLLRRLKLNSDVFRVQILATDEQSLAKYGTKDESEKQEATQAKAVAKA